MIKMVVIEETDTRVIKGETHYSNRCVARTLDFEANYIADLAVDDGLIPYEQPGGPDTFVYYTMRTIEAIAAGILHTNEKVGFILIADPMRRESEQHGKARIYLPQLRAFFRMHAAGVWNGLIKPEGTRVQRTPASGRKYWNVSYPPLAPEAVLGKTEYITIADLNEAVQTLMSQLMERLPEAVADRLNYQLNQIARRVIVELFNDLGKRAGGRIDG